MLEGHWRMMRCIRRLKEQVEKQLQPFCAAHGITERSLRTLLCLHYEGPMTASALAKSTCMAGANVSSLCKRLAADGLIVRRRAPRDERQVLVSLSAKGRALVQAFVREFGADMPGPMAGNEYYELLERLERFTGQLDQNEEIAI